MQQLQILIKALEYIEEHLCEAVKTEEIADYCYCSKSSLEKIFRCLNRISVHDYIVRRKMSLAGKMLMERPEWTVLDIAVAFGFTSNEAFTRSFRQVWNVTPSEFRKAGFEGRMNKATILFPQYTGYTEIEMESKIESGDDRMRKNVDISELYDLFVQRKGCYFICCDVQHLGPINDVSRKAGDLAILTSLQRMDEATGEDDVVFRIGGDEFALLTNSKDVAYAESIAEKIRSCNGQPIVFEGKELPLSLHIGITKLEDGAIRYNELFTSLHQTIRESK